MVLSKSPSPSTPPYPPPSSPPPSPPLPSAPISMWNVRPTLFCWTLVSHVDDFMLPLHVTSTSISMGSCDDQLVMTNHTGEMHGVSLVQGVEGDLFTPKGGIYNTALNTRVFQQAWHSIFLDGRYKKYDWTVKIDLDAVFFASRLREALVPFTADHRAVMILNNGQICPNYSCVEGPIEVFSRAAIQRYEEHPGTCERSVNASEEGEDWYIYDCMRLLHVHPVSSAYQLSKSGLAGGDCNGHHMVAIHPLKSRQDWEECARSSLLSYSPGSESENLEEDSTVSDQASGSSDEASSG